MWSKTLQKLTSFTLIFALLFSITLRVPFEFFLYNASYADEKDFYNIISLIVDEDTYSEVQSKLIRYSRDVQAVLENTRVVILPTPIDTSVLDIASLNESLYFEGYKGIKDNVNFESRLIGTVLVGNLPLPTVFDTGRSSSSVLPYIDFEDKSYIYSHESKKYEKNDSADTKLTPEIWHGVISPNTGTPAGDIQALEDYFDKNHDFYTGNGVFDEDFGVLSGKKGVVESDYEPQVFYYDQFRENSALQYEKYVGYESYLKNIEDITYKRYSKDLAENVKNDVLGVQNQTIADLLINVDPSFDISGLSTGPDVNSSSDILTRYITDNTTKKFLEIFNGSTLSDMRKQVYNAGRYNDGGSRVNVDMPPFLISVLDQVSGEVIKNVNTVLETEITNLVTTGLARDIVIPINISKSSGASVSCRDVYTSYYYGQIADDINSASQCSIYRGSISNSGTLTESNRGYNINNVGLDTALCGQGMQYDNTAGRVSAGLSGFWGNNSPVNLNENYSNFDLGDINLKGGIRPVFDILGSKKIDDATKTPSPLDCINEGVMIQTYDEFPETRVSGPDDSESVTFCQLSFSLPLRPGDPVEYDVNPAGAGTTNTSRFCAAENIEVTPAQVFDSLYKDGLSTSLCTRKTASLDGNIFTSAIDSNIGGTTGRDGDESPICPITYVEAYNYKQIPSHILHISPTNEEFGLQVQGMFTPSLPIDKNRYIDFIGANGQGPNYGYQRIDFPQLFRVKLDSSTPVTFDNIAQKTKEHLDDISAQINTIRANSNPSLLTGKDLEIYNLLSTGTFSSTDIDLYDFIQSKPVETFSLDNQSKEISYFETLVFSIFWNNLNTPSAKYKFIFEEYLSNEFTGNDYNFHLPKAKKSYEIGYFAAPGDAQNMYVKLDPELKGVHPYADILSVNLALQTTLLSANAADPREIEGVFECAPPDGVNIFQWIPAVICWLQNMLPPTIKIGQGSCGGEDLFLDEDELAEIDACQGDANKNGIIDCIEQKLVGGSLALDSNAGRYFYNSAGVLSNEIYTNEGKLARFDSNSYVDTVLTRVEVPTDSSIPFSPENTRVIFDRNIPSLSGEELYKEAQNYVSFRDTYQRVYGGENTAYFYARGKDTNIYFSSSLQHTSLDGDIIVDLQSSERKVEIRGERILVTSYGVENAGEYFADNSVVASNLNNICIVDGGKNTLSNHAAAANTLSSAEEKLLLLIQNYSLSGNILELNYPLDIELSYGSEIVYSQTDISEATLSDVLPIFAASTSGRYELIVKDALGFVSYRTLDITPDTAVEIDPILATNIVETGGNISTHLFTILDQYSNAASGEIYTVDISISGGGLNFVESGAREIRYNVIDGYKAFRLKSSDITGMNTIDFTLRNLEGDVIDTRSEQIRTIDDINMEFSLIGDQAVVGGEEVSYNVRFTDDSGSLLTDLDSRVYFSIHNLYGKVTTPYVEVQGGIANISFTPGTLAARDIPVELQLEGGNEIYSESITILPEAPIKIHLALSKDKIEASVSDSSLLQATLKDRYDNDVFTDSSTQLSAEIADKSVNILSLDSIIQTVDQGRAQFRISGTDTPGLGYFKISSNPDLGNNSFDLIGQTPFDKTSLLIPTMKDGSGELTSTGRKFFQTYSETKYITKFVTKARLEASEAYIALPGVLQTQVSDFWDTTNYLRVNGIGENAGSIETFFFWDKDDIEGNSYNTMYSTLLGAPYGDITQENYLGGAMLFDPNNNALAVTSLLQTPYSFHDVFSFSRNGKAEIQRSSDITQDTTIIPSLDGDGRLMLDIHNEALEDYIGRAYYNISNSDNIAITLLDESYEATMFSGDNVRVSDINGKSVFEILETGRFTRFGGVSLSLDRGYVGEGLNILLSHGENIIGEILINEQSLATNITRDSSILDNKLTILNDTIVIYMQSNSYSTRIKKISQDEEILQVYYNDPFAAKYSLDNFHNNDTLGIESSYDESGISWQDSNTMLLSFAAGESVGESSKNFQSFSLINLGDPVISLKPLTNTFPNSTNEKSFDSTVGEIIEQDDNLIGYQVFDYNADDKKDLLTIHRDGYLKLYEQRDVRGDFIYHRSYGYAADGGSVRTVKTGDFTGDGYGDIFFVTQSGEAALFNNIEKDISRIDMSTQFSLSGSIIQAESYDMDSDGRDDIVTLDDAGEIHIFYGGGIYDSPIFTKKFIGDGYSVELSGTQINHGGAIYYDGLVQVSDSRAEDILLNSSEYLADYKASIDAVGTDGVYTPPVPDLIDASLVDSFLYIGIPYIPTDADPDNINQRAVLEEGFEVQVNDVANSVLDIEVDENISSVQDFISGYDDYITYTGFNNSYTALTYFLRSQYADSDGIEITKSFTDTTPPHLQTGDTIYFDISIKNTSATLKNNIAYVDTLPQFFSFVGDEFEVLSEGGRKIQRKYGVGEYNIILDGFALAPGEETIIRYELEALPLSYGHIQVGLYEAGEVGDDIYGDIIVKEDNTNCGQEADIFRSTAVRSYLKGLTTPSCNESDVDIGNTFPELRDENDNGIPDYLETLLTEDGDGNIIPSDDTAALQDYANEVLNDLTIDSDSDGIPDGDDSTPNTDSATDFMGALDNINEAIDEIAGDIDTLIEGLSCGFGGGSCFANPLNWAPLAPGNDPTLFGQPIGDGLHVNEGSPIFSALTGRQSSCGTSPCCLPSVYPATSQAFIPGPFCGPSSAGGRLGTWSSTNFVRLFVTPTLTGGVGIAACFGGPAIGAGNSNPIGVHPIVPGGNCIVAAMPLFGCEGGEGDPGVEGYPYPGGDFSVIHANCDGTEAEERATPLELESQFVLDYLEYLKSGVQPAGMYERYKDVFSTVTQHDSGNYYLPTEPLISIGGGGEGSMSASVTLDTSALAAGNFGDVVQVTNTRIAGFPGFMMDWVERQLDEITSKLTNLPKIFVILPDFGGIFDFSWEGFPERTKEAFETGKAESDVNRDTSESKLAGLRAQKASLDCSGENSLRCRTIDLQIATSGGEKYLNAGKETMSGIKEVYEFLGNIPLVNIETETIHVNVPWPDPTDLERAIVDWEFSLEQYKDEIQNAANSWSLGATCTGTAAEIARCQQEQEIGEKIQLQAGQFLDSLETNIGILHEYKEFPDRLADLINIKEVWLEQILCNIEAISSLLGEWISANGERFKAWVELYILIKAVLKSWQLFIDVFTGYEEECHQCKNERQDLQNFLFQLISAVIPSPPIIEFPKWPDIILDLHNVRAGINVYLPDFQMNLRPIVLPTLPTLSLPRSPSVTVNIPPLPLLPRFELPELPELPSLPTVELPDLPPPPKIPKLFGAVEAVLNIMKLVTKVMCILKSSPFVPEWRAGDQIAFLTERNGYLPTDFINIQPPAFSYSMISAIKVTTYVNFEFEMEFILEAVKAITAPLDDATNNIVNMFDITLSDMDYSNLTPDDITIDLGDEISLAPLSENPEGIYFLAGLIATKFDELLGYTTEHVDEKISNDEFISYVGGQLAHESISSDPRTRELQKLWSDVQNLTYSKEDTFIESLQENNRNKFQTIGEIFSTEIEHSQKQQHELRTLGSPDLIQEVVGEEDNRGEIYKDLMEKYNIKTLDAALELVSGPSQESQDLRNDIEKSGDDLMAQVRGGLESYKENTLAATLSPGPNAGGGSCSSSGAYEYTYEGMYVKEDGRNYKLFDYIDPLNGDEIPTISDIDNDGDDDVFYLVGGTLYFKENRKNSPTSSHISTPLTLNSSDNKFYNGDDYYEAINGFQEASVSDGAINIEFQRPTNSELKNFRVEYNTLVDRYIDDGNNLPRTAETHIVDAIADREERTPVVETPEYSIYDNLAVLSYAGAMNNLTLTTEKLINIKNDLLENKKVTLTSDAALYAGSSRFVIEYTYGGSDEAEIILVPAYSMIQFDRPAEIISVSGDAYVSLGIFVDIKDADILDYIGMPLLPGAHFDYSGDPSLLSASSHLDIRYYDGSTVGMDMRDISSYRLYDLGTSYGDDYRIRLEIPNDFYYARIAALEDGVYSTWSRQILLAPQSYSDTLAPQIGLNQKIKIPVYQQQSVDFTPYIYEDGGFTGISDVRVDFDTSVDSDGDGNTTNDRDTDNINIIKTPVSLEIEFGEYDTLFERNILLALTDDNGNIGEQEILFEVYAPEPNINNVIDTKIYGRIDEDLTNEPVRIYRYRGGVIERLQKVDGTDVSLTSGTGAYDFNASETASGLTLSYSGRTLATIDEYTGRIDIADVFTSTRVIPSNNPINTSAYPEIQVLLAGNPIFRQFMKMPLGNISVVGDLSVREDTGIYLKILDQSRYNTFTIPLSVAYNAGSVSVYENTDTTKTPILTVFRDGRINIDEILYRVDYRTLGDDASFVLVEKSTGDEIAELVYHMEASYILR